MEEKLIELYEETQLLTKDFRKKTYVENIAKLKEKYAELLEELRIYLNQDEVLLDGLGSCVAKHAFQKAERISGKRNRKMECLDYNIAMVSYVLPLIRDIKSVHANELAQKMAGTWNQMFPETQIGCPTIEEIMNGFRSSFCFVTTAVCQSLNKPDDCYELELLREYRDDYMMCDERRRLAVQEYYKVAPMIVGQINRRESAAEIYQSIWEKYLYPCVQLIEEKRLEDCEKCYTDMVRELEAEYLHI